VDRRTVSRIDPPVGAALASEDEINRRRGRIAHRTRLHLTQLKIWMAQCIAMQQACVNTPLQPTALSLVTTSEH